MPSIRCARALIVGAALSALTVLPTARVSGQDAGLTPGDVVRVNGDFVGTLMSIDQGNLTVLGEGKPTCWPGIQHGEAPRCDPAPPVRRVVEWSDATIERQLVEISYNRRMFVGFLIGAAALAPVGYATGPGLGYGKIGECVELSSVVCPNPIPREEFDALQRSHDQKRGAFAFGFLGGSIGAIIARKTANEWVQVSPPAPGSGSDAWTVGVRVPLANR